MHYIIVVALGSIAIMAGFPCSLLIVLFAFVKLLFFLYSVFMRERAFNRRKEKEKNPFLKVLAIFFMISFTAFLAYHVFLALNIRDEKLTILKVAEQDVENLRIQNLELVLEKAEIVSVDYIEKEARDKLRYSAEGEVLFVIPEELLESDWVEEELALAKGATGSQEEKNTQEIIKVWFDFLFVNGV